MRRGGESRTLPAMRRGTCPKCDGSEVHAARNGLGFGDGSRVGLRPHVETGFRGMVVPHQTTDVWTYVCAACGYAETYIIGEQALAFIRQSWPRVPVVPPAQPDAPGRGSTP